MTGSLDSLDGEVRGQSPSNQVGNGLSEGVDEEGDKDDGGGANEGPSLGNLSLLLKLVGNGVLGKLEEETERNVIVISLSVKGKQGARQTRVPLCRAGPCGTRPCLELA